MAMWNERLRNLPWPDFAASVRPVPYAAKLVLTGAFAGGLALLTQVLWWAATGEDVWALILRDARLTATLVLGRIALSERSSFEGEVLLAASVVHLYLSVFYAAIALPLARRLRVAPSLLAGAAYGALLYAVNLHVLTRLFPWFAEARGAAAFAAHVVFGIAALLVVRRAPPV